MPQRELNVRFRSQADMARPPLAYRPVADDPLPTKAPSKSRSAVGWQGCALKAGIQIEALPENPHLTPDAISGWLARRSAVGARL